jgi:DNA-binding transcriptional MerR regulator
MCSTHLSSNGRLQILARRYRIGELVRCGPFSRQTIHNYTIMGLIREAEWTEGGHRLYDESVFEQLSRIVELKRTKSLTEIRRILKEEQKPASGAPPCAGAAVATQDLSAPHEPEGSDREDKEGGDKMTDAAT